MDLNEYQDRASETVALDHLNNKACIQYCTLGIVSEAGEVADKLKKYMRDGGDLDDVQYDMAAELGDVLWYVAALATELGYRLEEIAEANLAKLSSRKERGVIGGSGDER